MLNTERAFFLSYMKRKKMHFSFYTWKGIKEITSLKKQIFLLTNRSLKTKLVFELK